MRISCKQWWPECLLVLAAAFFFLRELGTFPEAWLDDGLFMIVAKNIAEGRGYAMPVLDHLWKNTYFLAIGPTVLLPSALAIKLWGFSVATARTPMVLYLVATTLAFYTYALRIGDRSNARWATGLLISFSAFVNTGKPVMGEIPALLFLFLGLLHFERAMQSLRAATVCGIFLGLAFVTKTTMGLFFPALTCTWLVTLVGSGHGTRLSFSHDHWRVIYITVIALLTVIPFAPFLGMTDAGWIREVIQYGAAEGGSGFLRVLREQPELLTRFQYIYALGVLFVLGILGWYRAQRNMHPAHAAFVLSLALLILVYFLSERGFYRHLLPAHILLLPFVPYGTSLLFSRRIGALLLSFFILAQGLWQFDHRGSRRLNEAIPTAERLEKEFRNMRMVIEQPEVFVRLSQNPNWMFLSEEFQLRSFDRFPDLPETQAEHCLPLLRKMGAAEQATYPPERLTPIATRYILISPKPDCGVPYSTAE